MVFSFDNLCLSNTASMYLYTMDKKRLENEEEMEKKIFEQEGMKEEAHQPELKRQYEVDEEDEELMD
jgi:hypothetical protein